MPTPSQTLVVSSPQHFRFASFASSYFRNGKKVNYEFDTGFWGSSQRLPPHYVDPMRGVYLLKTTYISYIVHFLYRTSYISQDISNTEPLFYTIVWNMFTLSKTAKIITADSSGSYLIVSSIVLLKVNLAIPRPQGQRSDTVNYSSPYFTITNAHCARELCYKTRAFLGNNIIISWYTYGAQREKLSPRSLRLGLGAEIRSIVVAQWICRSTTVINYVLLRWHFK